MGLSTTFSTPNFLSGTLKKGSTFMIAFDHNLILRYFRLLAKNKNSPFYMPIYHQTDLDREKKVIFHDDRHEKTKKMYISDFLFLKLHHTLFLMIGRAFFKNIKMCEKRKIRKSLRLFCKNE